MKAVGLAVPERSIKPNSLLRFETGSYEFSGSFDA